MCLSIFQCVGAFAYYYEIDGIYYNYISKTKSLEVTNKNGDTDVYTGVVNIPSLVEIAGVSYSVTSIGNEAFKSCRLTSVTIPNSVTSIGRSAFENCIGLTAITVPNSVTSIGDYAFSGSGLTTVDIPNSVTSIGGCAFQWCYFLESVTIPNSVMSIGIYAFSCCEKLESIVVDKENPIYDSRNDCNAIIETATNTLMAGCSKTILPNNITSISDWAFSYCGNLPSVIIPEGVTSIGDYAFLYCSGLTSVTIPNSVTSIGDDAFCNCI